MTLTDKQELARLLALYQQEMIEHNEANIAERKKHEHAWQDNYYEGAKAKYNHARRNGEYTRAEFEENEQNEKRLNEHLTGLAERAFKKAIIVDIDMPDDVEEFKED